jgi:hypothetical protein
LSSPKEFKNRRKQLILNRLVHKINVRISYVPSTKIEL